MEFGHTHTLRKGFEVKYFSKIFFKFMSFLEQKEMRSKANQMINASLTTLLCIQALSQFFQQD